MKTNIRNNSYFPAPPKKISWEMTYTMLADIFIFVKIFWNYNFCQNFEYVG